MSLKAALRWTTDLRTYAEKIASRREAKTLTLAEIEGLSSAMATFAENIKREILDEHPRAHLPVMDEDLLAYGWAPGDYGIHCKDCKRSSLFDEPLCDEHSIRCRSCAVASYLKT